MIGIDGVDGVGKSTLARFLSWQLGIPSIETDMFLEKGRTYPSLRLDELSNLVEARHSLDRPIIIEGLYLLEILDCLNIDPDILIYVTKKDFCGSYGFKNRLKVYREKFEPQKKAGYIYEWSSDVSDNKQVEQTV